VIGKKRKSGSTCLQRCEIIKWVRGGATTRRERAGGGPWVKWTRQDHIISPLGDARNPSGIETKENKDGGKDPEKTMFEAWGHPWPRRVGLGKSSDSDVKGEANEEKEN